MAKTTVTADPVVVDPKHYKIEAEDDKARVLRVRYAPGEKSPMHSHPTTTAIFLTEGDARFTYPDGKTEDVKTTFGQVVEMPPTTHSPENIGSAPFELILVEHKH
jgi:quercetin dioxygenase-like cupin family protein